MTPPVPSVLAPPLHPIELLDHLLGTLLLVLSLGFVLLVELTRRRVLSLHQLTFCLASAVSTLTIGGFVEHNVPNDVLDLALFGYYTQTSTLLQLRYAPLVGAVVATVAFLVFISLCSCPCCCVVDGDGSHQRCVLTRLRHALSVYCLALFVLFLVLGMRLNARMRLSAIKPVGGTLHWQMLQTPLCVSTLHVGSLALVVLKDVLHHAAAPPSTTYQHKPAHSPPSNQLLQPIPQRPRSLTTNPQTIPTKYQQGGALPHSLGRVPSKSTISPPPRHPADASDDDSKPSAKSSTQVDKAPSQSGSPAPEPPFRGSSSPRSSNKSSVVQRVSPVRRRAATERDSTPPPTLTRRRATPVAQSPATAVPSPGDMSGLISSESESDDDVIVPSAVRQFTSEYAVANRLVAGIFRGGMPRQDRQDDVGNDNMPSPTSPWVLCYDEATAAPYYYCHATGESRWELPETSVGAAAPVHSKWE
ncbi:hypothetical protein H257_04401 [Aphanomyces astaci]|uniref:WW domain-containing protein n=1 Tax=Aphanomyces astaci TaxID=112090 RepID=W4GXN6_APHAT|nr:hypothetical protein H257_04401 [Aphanomyces astaci]ETV83779.1 hypothetical protein H257_04401 [Aphanomyces astaci]RQM26552.1 hypothetical protein B5M09_001551 [Aphanomyces astaci]|eukprot:XP_009827209.1 hypothetical protein H257_04401 [Aphanomyces astaci]